jgi:hypothetical protein
MSTHGTERQYGTAQAAMLAALTAAFVLGPLFWFVGVLHFGFVSGPDPTPRLMISYLAWTSFAGIVVLASFLHLFVGRGRRRTLGYGRACLVAAAALLPLQAATSVVTLTQWGGDELVVIVALIAFVTALIVLTERLSETVPETMA